ncbi:MAG: DNA polymerase III subunit epsilon [Alphaproteobacteria bacterium]|nr:MAG: DNA polymerase III subunit epsilon [Alphaproteobacteria bacterium]
MREVVLDTETTGLDPREGHRIVEIGAVELANHLPTGRVYHQYINPERPMPAEAFAVHGLGDDFLRSKPVFSAIADAFLNFLGDARLVIHNAAFDMGFLNAELDNCGRARIEETRAIDTVAMARRMFPGAQASLDALCRRFGIDNSQRDKHGALLDAELLAEVYLELVGGRQPGLTLQGPGRADDRGGARAMPAAPPRPVPLKPRLTAAERAAHAAFVAGLDGKSLWSGD